MKKEKRKEKPFLEFPELASNMKKIQKASKLRQCDFYEQHLSNVPGAPELSTDATRDNTLSEMISGKRVIPLSFLPVYAELGGISYDRLLTGSDFTPGVKDPTYGDVLQLLYALLSKDAAEIKDDGTGITLKDPALIKMLGVLCALDQIQRDGFGFFDSSDMVRGLLQHEEMQEPVFDASSVPAATLRKLAADAIQEDPEDLPENMKENARDKMLRLIRCTALRKVSK